MKKNFEPIFSSLGPAVTRIGLSLYFLWFGYEQLMNSAAWAGFIPDSLLALVPFNAATLVHANGAFETVFGVSLLLGIFTRTSAFMLTVHMFQIVSMMGVNSIGVRDFGLSMATLGIFFYGRDVLCLETYLMPKHVETQETTGPTRPSLPPFPPGSPRPPMPAPSPKITTAGSAITINNPQ